MKLETVSKGSLIMEQSFQQVNNAIDIPTLKQIADCRAIFRRFWPGHFREQGNCVCPWHEDGTPSCQVSKELAFCHACNAKFDAIDLYQRGADTSKREAIRLLAEELNLAGSNGNQHKRQIKQGHKPPKAFIDRWKSLLKNPVPVEAIDYLGVSRGLQGMAAELQAARKLAFDPRYPAGKDRWRVVGFPLVNVDQKEMLGIQYVSIDGLGKKFAAGTNAKEAFFFHGSGKEFCVITGAVLDALSAYHACRSNLDLEVVSILSEGKGYTNKLKELHRLTPVIFFDNDDAGRKATDAAVRILDGNCRVVDWKIAPAGMKDVNDLLKAGHADVIERMVLASRIPTEGEVKALETEEDPRPEIVIRGGELHAVAARALELMRNAGVVFARDGELVRICGEKIYPVSIPWLQVHLTELARFRKYDGRSQGLKNVDCPYELSRAIVCMNGKWGLPILRGMITAPVLTPTGRLIDKPGFDTETGLFLHLESSQWEPIPPRSTGQDVQEAVTSLWKPFVDFPFVGAADKGGFLAALLTAVVRSTLPTAPGFILSSPTAGSGKSLLAFCLEMLAGEIPRAMSIGTCEEELGKILLAELRQYSRCILFDNLQAPVQSESLCAFLTSPYFSGRLLGSSQVIGGEPCAFVVLTGNNVAVVGDLCRRLIRVKIDPRCEQPFCRTFDIDPLAYTQEHRFEMVRAALIILLASLQSGFRHDGGRLASFEVWSDFVRNAVVWVGRQGWIDVSDPVSSLAESYSLDVETRRLKSLMEAWTTAFDPRGGTVNEAIKLSKNDADFFDVLFEIAGKNEKIDPRILGNWIARHEHRILDGSCFARAGERRKGQIWAIQQGEIREFQGSFPATRGNCQIENTCMRDSVNDSFKKEEENAPTTRLTPHLPAQKRELLI
jgi:hypothetical protein